MYKFPLIFINNMNFCFNLLCNSSFSMHVSSPFIPLWGIFHVVMDSHVPPPPWVKRGVKRKIIHPCNKKTPLLFPSPLYTSRGVDPKNSSRFGFSNQNNQLLDILHGDISQVNKSHLLSPPLQIWNQHPK